MTRYTFGLHCVLLVLSNVDLTQAGFGSGNVAGPRYGATSHRYSYGGMRNSSFSYFGTSSHKYPKSQGILHSSTTSRFGSNRGLNKDTVNIRHYYYNPPQEIRYAWVHGGVSISYPVHHRTLPDYVYQYKDSGSRYSSLLAGLALLNLGAITGGPVGNGTGHLSSSNNDNYQAYITQPGEVCLFGVKNYNGHFVEAKIDCQLISSFIYAEQAKKEQQNSWNQTTATINVTNKTVDDTANAQSMASLSPNGTFVKTEAAPSAKNVPGENVTQSVSAKVTNSIVVDAVDVKGPPIYVTPGMECYVTRKTYISTMEKIMPCGLLQTYADKSFKPNSAAVVPTLAAVCAMFLVCSFQGSEFCFFAQ